MVYKVHKALKRLKRWRDSSRLLVVLVILLDKFERVFSNEAGEFASLLTPLVKGTQCAMIESTRQGNTNFPWP